MSCVTGDDTGLLKVWDVSKSYGATMSFSYGEQSRERGIMGLCWMDSSTTQVAFSTKDGCMTVLDISSKTVTKRENVGVVAGLSTSMSCMKEKLVVVDPNGQIKGFDSSLKEIFSFDSTGPVEATHLHRKYGMISLGGKENDLKVYDIASERIGEPIFSAVNAHDHILGVPYPVYVTGTCIINPFVFVACTAYHQVRFYDRRASNRAVQEYEISREIDRRPTCLMQWNANKFLIGEASGDVHLYDTRRGFTSRAKLRGGTGSVRSLAKHPSGHQILGVGGLDRKVRLYHVPTGKLLMSLYTKQKCNCILFDKQTPLTDNISSFSGITNQKKSNENSAVSSNIWDDMDPIVDEFDDTAVASAGKKRLRE